MTGTSVVIEKPESPRSAPANVVWMKFSVADPRPLPDGFRSIDELIAEHERDAEGRAALAEARKFVAATFYSDDQPRLAAYRLAKGWSQKRLAEEVGTSQSHIARIELGQSDPQISTVRRLCEVLGITIEQFERAFPGARQSP